MAWTTPRTWVTAETVTAALMNAHVRDNLRETSPFTVTTAGDLSYADAANSMNSRLGIGAANGLLVSTGSAPVWRSPATDVDAGSGSSADTAYKNLGDSFTWNFASQIEVTVTTGTAALVLFKAQMRNTTAGALTVLSFAVSGASTVAAADASSVNYESSNANDIANIGGFDMRALTAGSNTFTLQGRVTAGTGTISYPELVVIPL